MYEKPKSSQKILTQRLKRTYKHKLRLLAAYLKHPNKTEAKKIKNTLREF